MKTYVESCKRIECKHNKGEKCTLKCINIVEHGYKSSFGGCSLDYVWECEEYEK